MNEEEKPEYTKYKSYDYRVNSNLVLQPAKRVNKEDQPDTEADTLSDKKLFPMGDKYQSRKPPTYLQKSEKSKKKSTSSSSSTLKKKILKKKTTNLSILNLETQYLYYQPKSQQTQTFYDNFLNFIQTFYGDIEGQALKEAGDEIITILKDDTFNFLTKKQKIQQDHLLKSITEEQFSKLIDFSKNLTDYIQPEKKTKEESEKNEDQKEEEEEDEEGNKKKQKIEDEEEEIPVVFDEEKLESNIDEKNQLLEQDENNKGNKEEKSMDFYSEYVQEEEEDESDEEKKELEGEIKEKNEEEELEILKTDGASEEYQFGLKTTGGSEKQFLETTELTDEVAAEAIEGTSFGIFSKNEINQKRNKEKQMFDLDAKNIDAYWLQRELSVYYKDPIAAQSKSIEVLNILEEKDNRTCENQLVLCLEYEKLKLIQKLLKNRWKIVYCTKLSRSKNDEEKNEIKKIMSKDEKLKKILEELEGNKINLNQKKEKDEKKEEEIKEKEKMEIDEKKIENESEEDNKLKILDLETLSFENGSHFMANKKIEGLPSGTKRVQHKGYEEVIVPGLKSKKVTEEEIVTIEKMPKWTKPSFPKVEKLNPVQSKVYPIAFGSNENMLMCAPTGSGKTNVAVLTILHEIEKFIDTEKGILKELEEGFKIIYIAPMKALVQEMVGNFSIRFKDFGIKVGELTGDSNMNRKQIDETHIIVTTPEKWDIVTRKTGDRSYINQVKLIIIDEIHLLHDDRGPVLESIVARTIRQQETTGDLIRLIGLSATLPNYIDVGKFLRVKDENIFYFDNSYRPCPLQQTYIGINEKKILKRVQLMNDICYEKVLNQAGKSQTLVFVHSRKETFKTATFLKDKAIEKDTIGKFLVDISTREILKSEKEHTNSNELKELLSYGFAIHHAGMSRSDRSLVEDLFSSGHIKVLVSTATLAWGVNLPAHTVIIKGTQIYNPEKSRWAELSALDIMQMMGRAGRIRYDSYGEGIIITSHKELHYYLSLLNHQLPIESQMINRIVDQLNAEIVLGTVRNFNEACDWIKYTYLYLRMKKNPILYGIISNEEIENKKIKIEELIDKRINDLIHTAADLLNKHGLIKYDQKLGEFQVTNLGRIASYYYISYRSMSTYNENLKPSMSDVDIFRLFSLSDEFKYMTVRNEEKLEIEKLLQRVPIPIKETVDDPIAKVNVLLQTYISRLKFEGYALIGDMTYITQSAARISRALFEIVIGKGWSGLAKKILNLCKMIETRMFLSQSPLRQFKKIPIDIIRQLEKKDLPSWDKLNDLTPVELGELIRFPKMGKTLYKYIHQLPRLDITATVQPITRSMLRIDLLITPDFQYSPVIHGIAQEFWIIVEDCDGELILNSEKFLLKEKFKDNEHYLSFTVPLYEPLPPQYFIRVLSDRWVCSETFVPISFRQLTLPDKFDLPTELLDLKPLSVESGIENKNYEKFIFENIKEFNSIQTQVFHSLYKTDENILLSTPVGSGKTICAEISILKSFNDDLNSKCVYISPIEEISKIRFEEWKEKFLKINKKVVLLTGENSTDLQLIEEGDIIISIPKYWDMISRRWKTRKTIKNINLFIMDDLQIIGTEKGPILEVIGSRTRYISSKQTNKIRVIGLCSSVANSKDLGDWIGCKKQYIFNFHPKVRPYPLEIKIQGFNQSTFSSRMISMYKPTYIALNQQDDEKIVKPVIIFTPSKKQSRYLLTEIITFIVKDGNENKFIGLPQNEIKEYITKISNKNLKNSVIYGVGILTDSLKQSDRDLIKILFFNGAIKVLICSFEECWSMDNFFSYNVIIMGTQYYNYKENRYVDYSIIDVLKMMGRANYKQQGGKCNLFCYAPKQDYYLKFLYEPIPIESHLNHFVTDTINSEIETKNINTTQDAVDYFTWTFLFTRIKKNPNYYGLQGKTNQYISDYLSELVENTISDLKTSKCVLTEPNKETNIDNIFSLNLGLIASFYYINCSTIELFDSSISLKTQLRGIFEIICASNEFDTLPIRYKEDEILEKLSQHSKLKLSSSNNSKPNDYNNSHVKVNLLLQSHFSRKRLNLQLEKDKENILPTCVSLIHAMVDVISTSGYLKPALSAIELCQMIVQAIWDDDSYLLQLPYFDKDFINEIQSKFKNEDGEKIETIPDFINLNENHLQNILKYFDEEKQKEITKSLDRYPILEVNYKIKNENNIKTKSNIKLNVKIEVDVTQFDNDRLVFAPFYPKKKNEEWWVIVGDTNKNILSSIKKISNIYSKKFNGKYDLDLEFEAPKEKGQYVYQLYLMCDSYLGCDQEFEINFNVEEGVEEEEEEEEEENEQEEVQQKQDEIEVKKEKQIEEKDENMNEK